MDVRDIRALDRRALDATGDVVARVTAGALEVPTPCAEWNLRALLMHMTGNNNGFADAADGKPADPGVWEGVGIGGDLVGEYQKSAERVCAAFAADGVMDRAFDVHGFGSYPAQIAIGMHFVDYLVHGWDVARAIGVDHRLDADLCLTVLRMGERWPKSSWGPGAPFGYPVAVPGVAPPDHRMLGFLGRSPNWPGV
jgi:uncharacterized protein (TIGR03086 family)